MGTYISFNWGGAGKSASKLTPAGKRYKKRIKKSGGRKAKATSHKTKKKSARKAKATSKKMKAKKRRSGGLNR